MKRGIVMKGMFVADWAWKPYAYLLAIGLKTIETRNKDMLSALVGERVAVISTRKGRQPIVVGYVTVTGKSFCKAEDFRKYDNQHLVPEGSKFDVHGKGKWFYHVADAETCDPYFLPTSAIRHGRSWCEF